MSATSRPSPLASSIPACLLAFVHIAQSDGQTARGDDGVRPRGHRRDAILEAAAGLFSEHGYRGTGVDDIGQAAGITGPGVYRHFDNKNDLLEAVVKRAVTALVEGVAAVIAEAEDSWATIEGLLDNMISAVLSDRAGWAVVISEQRHLEPSSRRGLSRAQRLHIQEWVDAMQSVRPDLSDEEVRVVVHGVLGLTAPFAARFNAGLDDEHLRTILKEMGMGVIRRASPAAAAR